MGASRVVMHQIVAPSEVDALGICFGGQVSCSCRGLLAAAVACLSVQLAQSWGRPWPTGRGYNARPADARAPFSAVYVAQRAPDWLLRHRSWQQSYLRPTGSDSMMWREGLLLRKLCCCCRCCPG